MKLLRLIFPFWFAYHAEWELPGPYRFARRVGGIVRRGAEI